MLAVTVTGAALAWSSTTPLVHETRTRPMRMQQVVDAPTAGIMTDPMFLDEAALLADCMSSPAEPETLPLSTLPSLTWSLVRSRVRSFVPHR